MSRTAVAVALLAAAGATPAWSALQIAFQNGATTFNCRDGQACDLAGPTSELLILNQQIGAFHVEGNFAASSPDTLSDSNLTITNTSGTTQTLVFAVSDTNFKAPVSFLNESGSGTFEDTVGGSGSLSFHADTGDAQGADTATDTPGVLLFNPSATFNTNPFAFEGNHSNAFNASDPFSMTLDYSLTLKPGGSAVGLESAITTGVPEPSTWAMVLGGFGLLTWLGMHKKAGSRFFEA